MNIYKAISGVTGKNLPFSLKNIARTLLDMILKSNKKIEELEVKIDNLPTEGGGNNERDFEYEAFMSWVISENVVDWGNNARIVYNYDPDKQGTKYYNAGFLDFEAMENTQEGEETNYTYVVFDYEEYLLGSKEGHSYLFSVPVPPKEILRPDEEPTYNLEAENQTMIEPMIRDLKGKSYVVLSWVD